MSKKDIVKTKSKFNHRLIEKTWQKKWLRERVYSPDIRSAKKPFYNLMMFPYPSAEGLHVGNMYAFTGADVHGRYHRMNGFDVFEPIGLDGFGIHSENYAIKVGRHPKEHAAISEKNFYKQLAAIGNGFAWENRLETYDPDYYKWTQWLFIKMFKAGLAYKGMAVVNWCPSCKTVLADEQVENSRCERCKTEVERRKMQSWFFRITNYADRLLEGLEKIDWPQKIKTAQKNWIGKKKGAEVQFAVRGSRFTIPIFTTRLDTIFGATFLVVSPEVAEKLLKLVPEAKKKKVSEYIRRSLKKTEQARKKGERDKSGLDMGIFAVNPVNKKEIPVYVADYVLTDVGTGAIMGVPAHDARDFEFAKRHGLPVKPVISPTFKGQSFKGVFEGEGVLVNSGKYSGLTSRKAREKILADLKKSGIAKRKTNYHLRDWLISRQRYWGPPIPLVFCQNCANELKTGGKGLGIEDKRSRIKDKYGVGAVENPGWFPVAEEELPVLLPDIKDFKPRGDGTSPLANAPESWKKVKCPECGGVASRELDVSDTFLDSSWYFLRYPSVNSKTKDKLPWDKKITKKWLPVDAYIGGAEHAVLHLLYARFVWKFLVDFKLLPEGLGYEPFPFLFSHGLIIKDGAKMSKSRGNVVVPDVYIQKYGADAFRTYLMFLGPFDAGGDFRDTGIEGMSRFMNRVWDLFVNQKDVVLTTEKDSREVLIKMHKTIKKVTEDIEVFRFNTAIAAIMEFVNLLREKAGSTAAKRLQATEKTVDCSLWTESLKTLALLLSPFAPHLTEEVWVNVLGQKFSIHTVAWPKYEKSLIKDEEVVVAVQVNGKLRGQVKVELGQREDREKVVELAKAQKNVAKWLTGKKILKTIFVPGKIVNFVVGE